MSEDQDNPTKFNNKADGKTNPKDLVRVERQEFFSDLFLTLKCWLDMNKYVLVPLIE